MAQLVAIAAPDLPNQFIFERNSAGPLGEELQNAVLLRTEPLHRPIGKSNGQIRRDCGGPEGERRVAHRHPGGAADQFRTGGPAANQELRHPHEQLGVMIGLAEKVVRSGLQVVDGQM